MGRDQIRKIVDLQVARLRKQLEEKGIHLDVTNAALSAIAEEGYDPTYGARPLKRVIQQRIQNPLAVELLRSEFGEGSRVQIDYRDGEFTFERTSRHSAWPAGLANPVNAAHTSPTTASQASGCSDGTSEHCDTRRSRPP